MQTKESARFVLTVNGKKEKIIVIKNGKCWHSPGLESKNPKKQSPIHGVFRPLAHWSVGFLKFDSKS